CRRGRDPELPRVLKLLCGEAVEGFTGYYLPDGSQVLRSLVRINRIFHLDTPQACLGVVHYNAGYVVQKVNNSGTADFNAGIGIEHITRIFKQ
ncbi:MAG: hypothetical protein K9G47_13145, partial [Bacteroidales bacterium]|nr:hypothetical protein [Bacteroidales bacterium]